MMSTSKSKALGSQETLSGYNKDILARFFAFHTVILANFTQWEDIFQLWEGIFS
ncbi:MAG: hypothetical protein NT166_00510 [Candidatus Aminicenantes bacterium]|nr:hypothetical protein [Candidatus Aminicenantes bacterium]